MSRDRVEGIGPPVCGVLRGEPASYILGRMELRSPLKSQVFIPLPQGIHTVQPCQTSGCHPAFYRGFWLISVCQTVGLEFWIQEKKIYLDSTRGSRPDPQVFGTRGVLYTLMHQKLLTCALEPFSKLGLTEGSCLITRMRQCPTPYGSTMNQS
jgi:hypothetical protein